MAVKYTPAENRKLTNLVCPICKNRIRNVWLEKGSRIDGLIVKCKTCGSASIVKTTEY